jgi:hypothetical protein
VQEARRAKNTGSREGAKPRSFDERRTIMGYSDSFDFSEAHLNFLLFSGNPILVITSGLRLIHHRDTEFTENAINSESP